jgi:hypothetical protein
MPQVWLTCDEIAEFYHCDGAGARGRAFANQWERRRCSDGEIRVLLPQEEARAFMVRCLDQCEAEGTEPCEPAPAEMCEPDLPNAEGFEAAMAALRQVFGQVEHPRIEPEVAALAPVIKLGKARFYRQFSYSQAS